MSEKAKLEKEYDKAEVCVNVYRCSDCKNFVYVDYSNKTKPKFCPHCGAEFETERTPDELRDEIKRLYHAGKNKPYTINSINGTYQKIKNENEEEMESLLDELTEIANKNKE